MDKQPRRPNSLRPERRGFKGVRRSTPLLDEMSRRTERLGEEFREEIARMIGSQLKDPRIGFVTVTRVDVGTDLRNARVYVGVLGSEADREKTLTGLRQARSEERRVGKGGGGGGRAERA